MVNKNTKKESLFEKEAKLRLQKRRRKNLKKYAKKRVLIPCFIVLFFVLLGLYMFINSLCYQSTDDAFIEGRLISVAPKITGHVTSLLVNDNDYVKKGQLLLVIDDRDYKNKVDELQNALQEAGSNKISASKDIKKSTADLSGVNKTLDYAKKDFERYSKLKENDLCTKQEYDTAYTNYKKALEKQSAQKALLDAAKSQDKAKGANVGKIRAQLNQSKLNLSYTKIYAPQDGYISNRSVEEGNYVNVGQPLMSIVSPDVWIVANFKETQLTNMKKGQEVEIKIDTYPRKKFKGIVDSIQISTGAKSSLFPPENAVGSYIKVVQRIPVKILFTEDMSNYITAPGMSVVPKVKIR